MKTYRALPKGSTELCEYVVDEFQLAHMRTGRSTRDVGGLAVCGELATIQLNNNNKICSGCYADSRHRALEPSLAIIREYGIVGVDEYGHMKRITE